MKELVVCFTLAFAAGLTAIGHAGTASAQWPSDPTVNLPVCTAERRQWFPRITADGSGGAIITWRDERAGDCLWDVYVQKVDASGVCLWEKHGVRVSEVPEDQDWPEIVTDDLGGAIVLWRIGSLSYPKYGLYAQRVNHDGVLQWGKDGVLIPTISRPAWWWDDNVVPDGAGGAVFAFSVEIGLSYYVYVQRIDATGDAMWLPYGVPMSFLSGDQIGSQVTPDGSGGAIVSWSDRRNRNMDLYAQRVDSSGSVLWEHDGVPVCTKPGSQWYHCIVSDGVGGAVIAWVDSSDQVSIYAQRIDASGNARWEQNGIPICVAAGDKLGLDISSDGTGGAIIVWEDGRRPHLNVYAQRIDSSGNVRWTPDGIPLRSAPAVAEYNPTVTPDGAYGVVVAWSVLFETLESGAHSKGLWDDIYAQRIDSSGSFYWAADGVAISTAPGNQWRSKIASDGSGGAIVTWEDGRSWSTGEDIYAQNVNSDGSLGIKEITLVTGGGWIAGNSDGRNTKRTFGFNAHFEQGVVWGQLQFNDHATGMKVHSESFDSLIVFADTAACFSGSCRMDKVSGYSFTCEVEDRDEPGKGADRFTIRINDPDGNPYYSTGGLLGGGNIQIHRSPDLGPANRECAAVERPDPDSDRSHAVQLGMNNDRQSSWLSQNSPNPFHEMTTISYSIVAPSHVTLEIYDITGRLVETLVNETQHPGIHEIRWDRKTNPGGVYFCRLKAGKSAETRTMVLLE